MLHVAKDRARGRSDGLRLALRVGTGWRRGGEKQHAELPEEQREDLLRSVPFGEQALEERNRLTMISSNDRFGELEDVRLDRAAHERAHVRGAHRRATRVRAELLHLVLDALGIRTERERQRVHRVRLERDLMQPRAGADPALHLERQQAFDPLRAATDVLYRVRQRQLRRDADLRFTARPAATGAKRLDGDEDERGLAGE